MFLALAGSTILKLRRVSRKARAHPDLAWLAGLSDALQSGLAVFMTSGAFVGIAFQPMFWFSPPWASASMPICGGWRRHAPSLPAAGIRPLTPEPGIRTSWRTGAAVTPARSCMAGSRGAEIASAWPVHRRRRSEGFPSGHPLELSPGRRRMRPGRGPGRRPRLSPGVWRRTPASAAAPARSPAC